MDTLICPKGHQSSDHDYCSECGAKMGNAAGYGAGSAAAPVAAAVIDTQTCPDCGTLRDHKGVAFCEICGYNFTTGARGEVPINFSPAPVLLTPALEPVVFAEPPVEDVQGNDRTVWAVEVSVDGDLKLPDSPDAPEGIAPFTVALSKPVNLIGRTSQTRAIFPEVAIDFDDAVSHRHALLQFDPDGGLVVRDIGAANGTMINGKEIEPMVDYPLNAGDIITLGHWSRLTVKAEA